MQASGRLLAKIRRANRRQSPDRKCSCADRARGYDAGMSSAYDALLDATIRHFENLQAGGVRHVAVSPDTLKALVQPAPRAVQPARARTAPNASQPVAAVPAQVQQPQTPSIPLAVEPSLPLAAPATPPTSPPRLSPDAKAAAFAALRERVLACVKCDHLVSSRKNVVFGVGSINAELMFVGEAPGADEDEQGEPFVGKAGQLLTKIIETMGLQRSEVYIGNILKCRPDTPGQSAGNRKPTPEEMQTCISYLHEQIDLVQPKVIVALGATAVEGLLGKTVGITKLRGTWKTYRGIPLMPTYHPAYLLRNQAMSEKRKVWEDMLQVMEKLDMPISEKQQRFFLRS